MKKLILSAALAVCALSAQAVRIENGQFYGCRLNDAWSGPDKTKHIIAGGAIGAAVTTATREPLYGIAATAVVAIGKEAWDRRGHGTCSYQDFAVTVAAGALASYGTKWLIVPTKNGVIAMYSTKI